jgi:hypothetical protein
LGGVRGGIVGRGTATPSPHLHPPHSPSPLLPSSSPCSSPRPLSTPFLLPRARMLHASHSSLMQNPLYPVLYCHTGCTARPHTTWPRWRPPHRSTPRAPPSSLRRPTGCRRAHAFPFPPSYRPLSAGPLLLLLLSSGPCLGPPRTRLPHQQRAHIPPASVRPFCACAPFACPSLRRVSRTRAPQASTPARARGAAGPAAGGGRAGWARGAGGAAGAGGGAGAGCRHVCVRGHAPPDLPKARPLAPPPPPPPGLERQVPTQLTHTLPPLSHIPSTPTPRPLHAVVRSCTWRWRPRVRWTPRSASQRRGGGQGGARGELNL